MRRKCLDGCAGSLVIIRERHIDAYPLWSFRLGSGGAASRWAPVLGAEGFRTAFPTSSGLRHKVGF